MSSRRYLPSQSTSTGVAAAVLAATLLVGACRDGSVERAGRGTAVELGRTGGPDVEAPESLTVRWLVPPAAEAEPPLAAPVALGVDEGRGRLYVLETQPPELRVYDAGSGRFIGRLGREGDGPGEYRRPISVAVGRSGLVAVLSMSGRVTYWDASGSLVATVQAGPGLATDIVAARGDSFYVKSDIFPPADVAEFRIATIDSILNRPLFRDSLVPGTEEPGRPFRNHSYAVAATAAGDLLIAPPGPDYIILRVGRSGEVVSSVGRREVAPLRRSEAEIEAVRERVRRAFAALGRAAPSDLPVPVHRAHVGRLAVAPDASIWALTQRGDSTRVIIDRFGAEGVFLGSFVLRLRGSELAVSSAAIYLLARSGLDVTGVAVVRRPDSATN